MDMKQKPLTIAQFFKQFPDDETCLQHIFDVRFGQGYECPKCEKASNWYRIKAERAYSCQWCGHHLHPTVGTPFEKSRTPLQLWFYAIYLFTTTRHGVAAKELERQLGVTYKTAWRMAGLIREHMADVDGENPLGGFMKIVEVDETYIGGVNHGGGPGNKDGKTAIMGMLQRNGEVITVVIPNRRKSTLQGHIVANVLAHTEIHTDNFMSYAGLDGTGHKYWHKTVNHSVNQWVSPTGTTTNGIEGFWSQLKRGIFGTHIHVSPQHLWKYAKEAEYRFNRRHRPETMFSELVSTYQPLI